MLVRKAGVGDVLGERSIALGEPAVEKAIVETACITLALTRDGMPLPWHQGYQARVFVFASVGPNVGPKAGSLASIPTVQRGFVTRFDQPSNLNPLCVDRRGRRMRRARAARGQWRRVRIEKDVSGAHI